MPLTPPGLTGAVLAGLTASGFIGTAASQLALGVATGIVTWATSAAIVTSVDTGTLGVGAGTIPLVVPPPLLLGNLLVGFTAMAQIGVMAPVECAGLSIGISTGLAQGLVVTVHPGVGLGAAVVKIAGVSVASMITGFAAAGLHGTSAIQHATAIAMGLDLTIAELVLPSPIVGPPSIVPFAGVGTGKIV
jgi:hypothetical protein